METLYDERKVRKMPQTWVREDGEYTGVDIFYLRVRLFKAGGGSAEEYSGGRPSAPLLPAGRVRELRGRP